MIGVAMARGFKRITFRKIYHSSRRLVIWPGRKSAALPSLPLHGSWHKENDFVPIPGTTKRAHLEQNLEALSIHLSEEDLTRIDQIAPLDVAAGTRYDESGMARVNL